MKFRFETPIPTQEQQAQFGPIWLTSRTETIEATGRSPIKLSPQAYQILWLLIRMKGGIVTREEILEFLHEDTLESKDLPVSNGEDVKILEIRNALLELVGRRVELETMRREGFRLVLK